MYSNRPMTSESPFASRVKYRWLTVALCIGCSCGASRASELAVEGYLAVQGVQSRSQSSWLHGGFGRLTTGADADEGPSDSATDALGQLHVTLDWQPSRNWSAFVHAVARAEPSASRGDALGILEAYVQGEWVLGERALIRNRLGHFFLPTSRENVEVGWSSPYTLTFSALNSWIGEETRLTGLLSETTWDLANDDQLTFGASAFGGNDTNSTLLAWRGWALGDRISAFGEVLPLPPLSIFEEGGGFAVQRDDGTQPFAKDLDGRAGWAGYLRWHKDERFLVQFSHYDNQGDRGLHDGEYAWDTEMGLLGLELHRGQISWVGEYLWGTSGMGPPDQAHVDIDFAAAYLLTSWQPRDFRLTVRYDDFEVIDRDLTIYDNNNEDGHAWTFAAFWEPTTQLRVGVEYLEVEARRPDAVLSGFDPNTDGRSIKLELRWYFGL